MAEDFDFTKINQSSEKLAKTHESTIKHLIKSSTNEKTKAQLVANHIKLLKEELKINKDLKPKEIKAIEAEIKATKNATKTTKNFGAQMKSAGAGLISSIGKMALATAIAVPKTVLNFMDAGSGVKDFTSATKEFAGPLLHPMHMLGKSVDFNANIFKTLSQQGAGFGKSVLALRDAAHSANMPILDFVDMIQKNTTTFGALFGNVENGMASIEAFSRALRQRTKDELAEFGLNMEETSEFMMTQLEIQRVSGAREKLTTATLMDRTVEYAKQLTRLSKLTGISVKELDEQNRAAAVNGSFQATLSGMDKAQADRTRSMNAALEKTNPALAQMFKEMVAFGVPITDASKQLSILSGGAIPELMNSFKDGAMSDEQFLGGLRESVDLNSPFAAALARAGMLGGQGIADALNAAAAIIGIASNNIDDIMNKVAPENDGKALVGAKESLDTMLVAFQRESTGILRTVLETAKIGNLLETFGEYAGHIEKNLDGSIAKSSLDKLIGILAVLKEKLGSVTEYIFKGDDDKNMLDNWWDSLKRRGSDNKGLSSLWYKPEQSPQHPGSSGGAKSMYSGSNGFQDFGLGTPAILHGREAVIPAANSSQLVKDLLAMAKPDQVTNNNYTGQAPDIQALIAIGKGNLEATQKVNLALNTLVTIGAMTERNTKTSSRTLDSMGGSLV
jgi:hypothetical protein